MSKVKDELDDENTIVWLPHFLSEDRIADLATLIVINHLLERDRLAQVTPNLTAEDRHHAAPSSDSRRSAHHQPGSGEALPPRLRGEQPGDGTDLGPRAAGRAAGA